MKLDAFLQIVRKRFMDHEISTDGVSSNTLSAASWDMAGKHITTLDIGLDLIRQLNQRNIEPSIGWLQEDASWLALIQEVVGETVGSYLESTDSDLRKKDQQRRS